ncbi:hypothetical protein HXX76_005217 [Chlamydomonas incerta]|uniref:Uncharacterized protein n=1 Tax=Chlamydomonas incerta TaxID=51695 RepID=A0A835W452_CHLIN|nr:hypothetical protein HXX76_005217 [Chlamydomonas incerta]|eukprot:KAG2438670.1 hypothetical protein HXX76_005217 [Chlamydomonas incerta]
MPSYALLAQLRAASPPDNGDTLLLAPSSAQLNALHQALAPDAFAAQPPSSAAASADRQSYEAAKAAQRSLVDNLNRWGCRAALGAHELLSLASSLMLAQGELAKAPPPGGGGGASKGCRQLSPTVVIVVVDQLRGSVGAAAAAASDNSRSGGAALVWADSRLPANATTGEPPGPRNKRWTTVVTLAQAVRAAGPAVARHDGQRVVEALRGLVAQAGLQQRMRVVAAPGAAEQIELRLWFKVLGAE